jgi:hypothetical protein
MMMIRTVVSALVILTLAPAWAEDPTAQSPPKSECKPEPSCAVLGSPLVPGAPTAPARNVAKVPSENGIFQKGPLVIKHEDFRLPSNVIL